MYFKLSCILLLFCFSCNKQINVIFDQGIINVHEIPDSIYQNDLVHPSIVYIPNGLGDQGSKWWMVGTPYPGDSSFRDNQLENPILFRGVSNDATPPTTWEYVAVIAKTPPNGAYNSDPCLFYDSSKLWIFWRENRSPEVLALGARRAVYSLYTMDGVSFSEKRIVSIHNEKEEDLNMAPCVFKNKDNNISLYATHYSFRDNKRKNIGVALWDLSGTLDSGRFVLKGTSKLKGQGEFDYWHGDYFVQDNVVYLVASNEIGNAIKIAKSEDGLNFKFYRTPLITTSSSRYEYMYKPCARVVDGIFYFWHPARINDKNRIILHSENWKELISTLEDEE